MHVGRRTRRDWAIALAASLLLHLVLLGFVRFAPVPSADVADEPTRVAILRITKRVSYAHGRRGGDAAAPPVSSAKPHRSGQAANVSRGASAAGSKRAATTAPARPAGETPAQSHVRPAAGAEPGTDDAAASAGTAATGSRASSPGAEESPGPAPTVTAEMLASLNRQIRDAIPSAAPQTMKHVTTDLGTLAVRPDPDRWTVANYPLPHNGLFAHAIIVRVGREAVAVRAIRRIGNAYICVGYLAKINEHNPDATLAGPYIGPCKKAWREQLGLVQKPSSTQTSEPNAAPSGAPSPTSNPPPFGDNIAEFAKIWPLSVGKTVRYRRAEPRGGSRYWSDEVTVVGTETLRIGEKSVDTYVRALELARREPRQHLGRHRDDRGTRWR